MSAPSPVGSMLPTPSRGDRRPVPAHFDPPPEGRDVLVPHHNGTRPKFRGRLRRAGRGRVTGHRRTGRVCDVSRRVRGLDPHRRRGCMSDRPPLAKPLLEFIPAGRHGPAGLGAGRPGAPGEEAEREGGADGEGTLDLGEAHGFLHCVSRARARTLSKWRRGLRRARQVALRGKRNECQCGAGDGRTYSHTRRRKETRPADDAR